jgi:hypothetical protein
VRIKPTIFLSSGQIANCELIYRFREFACRSTSDC